MKFRNIIWLLVIALPMFFMACDLEEAVEDQVDNDFKENEKIELEPIEYEVADGQVTAYGQECGMTSVNAELDRIGVDQDDVDIDDVTLRWVELKYQNATWTPEEITELNCSVLFGSDEQGYAVVWETAVNGASTTWTKVDVDAQAQQVINYYLQHRGEQFFYCAQCDDDPDTAYVEFLVNIGVTVKGEVKID